jgi:hypothetical protein
MNASPKQGEGVLSVLNRRATEAGFYGETDHELMVVIDTIAEYQRVLIMIANKEGDFHDDNDALDRFAEAAQGALSRCGDLA